ncbi:hypothetical protein ACKC9G_17420 [Pokkaliibacter sp. CJK22405]|uniref:hypothetical protein n=1 Tax=Pokkaliibacter sp. CJK22405 TaxID=3384615 RepID=UPI0039847D54
MPIHYKKKVAHLQGEISVEEAENLWQWLNEANKPGLNLSKCEHLHTANLQVLLACRPAITHWPENAELTAWLKPVLTITEETAS